MKHIKIRHIFILLIVLVLVITLILYFFTGLEAKALDNNNEDFDLTGYVDFSEYDKDGNKTEEFSSQAEVDARVAGLDPSTYEVRSENDKFILTFKLLDDRIVAQNDKYTMFLNEKTTVISVAENSTCNANGNTADGFINYEKSSCSTVYNTAYDEHLLNEAKSNFVLYYVSKNDKLSTIGYNSYANSVLYDDLLLGTTTRHYKIKYNVENGIEILYEIGDFNAINSYFPEQFDRKEMENYFRGNLVFVIKNSEVTSNNKLVYDSAYTWSSECAAYLEENNLATVTPFYSPNSKLDENGEKIPSRWNLTDILEENEEGKKLNKLKMKAGIDYNPSQANVEGASPCVANPFMNSFTYAKFFEDYYDLMSVSENSEIEYDPEWRIDVNNSSPTFRLTATSTLQFNQLFEYMYKKDTPDNENFFYEYIVNKEKIPITYDENPYDENDEGTKVPIGGFQARDEEGNFLYEDGKPVQAVFTKELASIQNDLFGNSADSNSPRFQIAMKFVLSNEGLESTILNESLIEGLGTNYRVNGNSTVYSHDFRLGLVDVLPYFTSNDSEFSEGQIIVPDGSGAIISFNSVKDSLNYNAYGKPIYGLDQAFTFRSIETMMNEKLMLGMYGFLDKTEEKGVLAIVDKGANQTSIYSNFKRKSNATTMNIANFKSLFRESETVFAGSAPFLKWASDYVNTDFKYIYNFLSEDEFLDDDGKIQYVTLANKYRDYLIDKYNIESNDEDNDSSKTKQNVVSINFLGAFEKRQLTLGFAHNQDFSLTTFSEAQTIIEELKGEGITNFNVSYTGWTKEALVPKFTDEVNVSKVLGKKAGLQSFNEYLKSNNINLYPEIRITSSKGYDYLFGNTKYTAKSIGSYYAQHPEFLISTDIINPKVSPTTMISPKFYNAYITNYMKSYTDLNISGAYLSDIGNVRVGDYRKNINIYAENGMYYQHDAINYVNEKVGNILLSAPYDYAFQYAKFAVDVPLESSLLGYYDYTIPFYQLVISGLFDYTGPAVNYDSEHSANWYLLKSLETGSNLYFMLSYEDTKTLLNTNYTMYYNAYYKNWKNEIIQMNDIINSTKIHNGTLINHKILNDNVYQVEYSNGTKLIINYNQTIYNDINTGRSVDPNWFIVVEEGS